MTLKQFLRKLRRTPRNWRLENGVSIRTRGDGNNCHCPISAVVILQTGDKELARSALFNPSIMGVSQLKLRKSIADNIANAADTKDEYVSHHIAGLRHKLKTACGMR